MKVWGEKNLIIAMMVMLIGLPASAESLFYTGISENQAYSSIQPRSLYNSGRARGVGDIVTIELDETIATNDTMKYQLERSSELEDSF